MNRLPDYQQKETSDLVREIDKTVDADHRKLLSAKILREIEAINASVDALVKIVKRKEARGLTWLRRWNTVNGRRVMMFLFLLTIPSCATADEIDDIIPVIIEIESGGDAFALSEDNCRGLMQISEIVVKEYNDCPMSETASAGIMAQFYQEGLLPRKIDEQELYDETINKKLGEWYLRRLKDHYLKDNYTIERMLAAYNGGITRLRNVDYDINRMPKETRDYVKKVMRLLFPMFLEGSR